MNSHNDIHDELNGLGSNLPPKENQPFEVPKGYFEGLASSIMAKIKTENISAADELQQISPFLAGINRAMPYSIPDGYFENLGNEAPFLIRDEVLPQSLSMAGKAMPYLVPNGYFENLSGNIISKLEIEKPKAKVVSFSRGWMKYAAAAVITAVVATTGFLYFGNNKSIDPAKQPDVWVAQKLENVSDQALDEFMKTTGVSTKNQQLAKSDQNKPEVKKLLKDVSNEELDMFLSQVPSDNEELLIN